MKETEDPLTMVSCLSEMLLLLVIPFKGLSPEFQLGKGRGY